LDKVVPFVDINGVNKVYQSKRKPVFALKDVNLTIRKAEFVSVLGPSGCGKSTLLKCIAGLESISSGNLLVDGAAVNAPPSNMGVVFQRDLLLDWRTILDNVLLYAEFRGLPRGEYASRARAVLDLFGLGAFADRYPWELSGGMRQRASICRALLVDPHLLLMDEPFGALDAMTRDELNFELQRTWLETRKTVVFITHSISEAVYLGDRVIVMSPNPGGIVDELEIDLERPRPLSIRETPRFGAYVAHIRDTFTRLDVLRGH
jgi:NitT/TauT family transport system ATP-binding protein